MADEQSLRDEDVCILQQQMHENESRYSQTIQQLEFDLSKYKQKVLSKNDHEAACERELKQSKKEFESLKSQFERQEEALNNKVTELNKQLQGREKDNCTMREKLQSLQETCDRLQTQVVDVQSRAASEVQSYQAKLEELKAKS